MLLSRLAPSFALCLFACAAHEVPADPPPTPTVRVEVKVASVQLVQDCVDPPTDAAAEAKLVQAEPTAAPLDNQVAAAMPAPDGAVQPQRVAAGAALLADGPGGWSPPCTQSTVQLSVANVGETTGKLHVAAVRLFDARTNKELGKLSARKPSQWNAVGTYQPWDEVVTGGATVKVGYRLGEPDWAAVDAIVGTDTNPYVRPYVLELDIAVEGGGLQTVRSPEFVREPIHVIVT